MTPPALKDKYCLVGLHYLFLVLPLVIETLVTVSSLLPLVTAGRAVGVVKVRKGVTVGNLNTVVTVDTILALVTVVNSLGKSAPLLCLNHFPQK